MKRIYDLPRIGPYLRALKYDRHFNNLRPGDIAIDCGANVGKVTRRMAKPGVKVYAFEPDPNAFAALEDNLAGIPDVTLFNKAVSDHNGREKIYFSTRYSEDPLKWSTGSSLLSSKGNVDKSNFMECEVVDLAQFISSLGKAVTLLKMDIEGEEVRVLNKLIDSGLAAKIKNILVETHERIPEIREGTKGLRKRIKNLKLRNIDLDWA